MAIVYDASSKTFNLSTGSSKIHAITSTGVIKLSEDHGVNWNTVNGASADIIGHIAHLPSVNKTLFASGFLYMSSDDGLTLQKLDIIMEGKMDEIIAALLAEEQREILEQGV